MSELARLAVAVNEAQFALGNETFEACGARFVRNVRFPQVRDANHVSHVTAATPREVAALFARMDREHAASPARSVHCDFATPPGVEAALLLAGFQSCTVILSVLDGPLRGAAAPHDVREASSTGDWQELHDLARRDWREACERQGRGDDPGVADALFGVRRLACPPARTFLVRAGDVSCGHVTALPGLGGMGQVEHLFVAPEHRRRGMARALIARAVEACREGGASSVLIAADATDTPKIAYAAMGFRPVAVKRDYWKDAAFSA